MLSRTALITAIDAVPEEARLTIKQIAFILKKSDNTVSGWLSNESYFPVTERGARNQKHYSKLAFIKLCLYIFAMGSNGGLRVPGQKALATLNNCDLLVALDLLRQNDSDFFSIF